MKPGARPPLCKMRPVAWLRLCGRFGRISRARLRALSAHLPCQLLFAAPLLRRHQARNSQRANCLAATAGKAPRRSSPHGRRQDPAAEHPPTPGCETPQRSSPARPTTRPRVE
ncbi:hypothetical protein PVAP13_6NG274306 [Panicum virgatum]|uniref:Uncharacterized protein n=1 Tax=Panicum virgatum TaxID=38727 RepID=A0A8T0R1X4_PANVG|nr:hypothetical protein PVAP13_6NG274306 [Panicum virgatum]